MRKTLIIAGMLIVAHSVAAFAADTETDRLREALRSALLQSRALEDQRAALQAQLSDMTKQRDQFKRDVDAAKAAAKKAQNDYRQAVTDFNARLEERNQALEKWKDAYEDAANVARTKDADRAKFESETKTLTAANKNLQAKNTQLVKVGQDVVSGYRNFTLMKVIGATEPLIGTAKVEHENETQNYQDRVLDQKVNP
jgi:chromosome segregation ATPase